MKFIEVLHLIILANECHNVMKLDLWAEDVTAKANDLKMKRLRSSSDDHMK
jgi:hypothetical protein